MPDMKPSFALNLSEDGVTLLHRTARGWLDVGHAAFADPDLPAALDYLRSTAMGLSPKGIAAKLIIPNDQILYTEVEAPGPSEDERRAQIAKALEGRTPYAVEDLAFDWSGAGPVVQVAVVAKETLAEAEGFAVEHRFNPVSFVAMPEADFGTEPFFGTSSVIDSILPKSQKLARDTETMTIVTRDLPKADPVAPEPTAESSTETAEPQPAPEEAVAPPEQAEQSDLAPEVRDEEGTATPTEPEPPVAPAEVFAPQIPESTAPETAVAPAEVETAHPAPEPEPAPAPLEPTKAIESPDDEAPMAVDVPAEDDLPPMPASLAPRVTSPSSPTLDDDLPPPPSSAAMMAFATRRANGEAVPPAHRPAPAVDARPTGAPPAMAATRPATVKAPTVERPAGAKPPPKFSYDDPVPPPPPRMPGDPPAIPTPPAATKPKKTLKELGGLVTAAGIAGSKPAKPVSKPVRPAKTIKPAEDAHTDVSPDALAKGLGVRARANPGKPRYLGLILTGILLLLLAAFAAWSSLILSQNSGKDPIETAVTEPSGDAASPGADETALAPEAIAPDLPSVDDEAAADGIDLAEDQPAAEPAADATVAAEDPAAQPMPTDEVAAPAEPAAEPAIAPETGIETAVNSAEQPAQEEQDEIFLAGTDTPPAASDPLSLPSPAETADALPAAPMMPPPFGTVYKFDENGRIVPTPQGIETPEGVLLLAGKPPILPPSRPQSVVDAAAAVSAPAEATTPEQPALPLAEAPLTPAETFGADPALAEARPRLRPETLIPASPAAGEDDASLALAEDSRFASLRPRLRPAAILAAGEESRRASEAASLAAQAAIAAAADAAVAEANADGSVSPMAVAVSRIPAPRPRDLSRAVEAAVAAATQPSSSRSSAPAPEKSTEEEADSEPETASVAPRIPTKTNVAKQATYVNAINLSKINLIGVYGSPSKRYALVRQSNGRYKKVGIGDSIDGGTVKAITASEVRYQKGGRLITLAMPKG